MKIIPSIDLLDGKVVRLKQGNPELATFYDYDPFTLIEKWYDVGVSRMHIVDLNATLERGDNYELIKKYSEDENEKINFIKNLIKLKEYSLAQLLINDILDITKIEYGNLKLLKEKTDLVSMTRDSLKIIEENASYNIYNN